ncbi:MAG: AMP-binding protein [candidate division FCPU426 bacterium]
MPARPDWTLQYSTETPKHLDSMPFASLADLARQMTKLYGPKTAFTLCLPNGSGASLSYTQLDHYSDAFAVWLREEAGLAPGSRVALQMPNCLAYPVAAFGVFKAGMVLVNTNPLYTAPEMEHQFADSGAEALVIIDLFADKLEGILKNTKIKKVVLASLTDFMPPFEKALIGFVLKFVKRQVPRCKVPHLAFVDTLKADGQKALAYASNIGLETLAALQYTGGTTGVSKGAMLSHGNLLWDMELSYQFARSKVTLGKEVVLTPLPLYHVFAFTVNLLVFFRSGAQNVLIPSPRPPSNLKAAFKKYPITWMTGVNTLYKALLRETWFVKNPPRFLKDCVAGGAALHSAVAEQWKQLFGDPVYEGYGLSEASPVLSFNPLSGNNRIGTIGVPLSNTDIKLVDESGQEVALGQAGEICAKGPQVMQGYWGQPEETAEVLKGGWLATGDIGVMDADGFIKIVDRKKDMINVSGLKVFPNEVEECLNGMPGVLEAAVIGVPYGETGEAVRAYLICKPGATVSIEEVREFCKTRLAHYKIPKQLRLRTELPKTPVGKILRKVLKAEAAEES